VIGNAVKVMPIATGEEIDELPTDDGKGPRHRLRHAGQDLWGVVRQHKGRYIPGECTGAIKTPIEGKPDPKHIQRATANAPT
jgi:hypothetical protein